MSEFVRVAMEMVLHQDGTHEYMKHMIVIPDTRVDHEARVAYTNKLAYLENLCPKN